MTVKEQLHALIESLDDAQAEALLALAASDLGQEPPPLTAQQVAELKRRMAARESASFIPHEAVFSRFEFRD